MKNLILASALVLFSSASAIASDYDDRARADWARQHAANQAEFKAHALQKSQAFREKIYRWTYTFTNGAPEVARSMVCSVEPVVCVNSMCLYASDRKTKVNLDALASTPYFVGQCEVTLPPPQDLACRLMNQPRTNAQGSFDSVTQATCYDKNSQVKQFWIE